MTPAIIELTKLKMSFELHEYQANPDHKSYGNEAAEMLCVTPERVFKTLVVETNELELAVAIIPVSKTLNLKKFAASLNVKKVQMADPKKVERSTGYVLGGVSPIGQKRALTTVVEQSAATQKTVFVSGGRRGLEIEMAPSDLITVTCAWYDELT